MPPPPPKKKGGCLSWLVGGLLLSLLSCCCLLGAIADSVDDPLNWEQVAQVAPALGDADALGVALRPGSLPESAARHFGWRHRLHAYDVGYGLSREYHQQVEDDFEALARRFDYLPGDGQNFTWAPPVNCHQREWECVFSQLAQDNAAHLAPLAQRFRERQQRDQLDARQLTELVVSFVQSLDYRLPTEDSAAFGLIPPTLVVTGGNGDCDSKALLAVILLRQLGVPANVLLASSLQHAALGVALPTTGKKFALNRVKYAFVEVTTPGWELGLVPPEYDVANAWRVIAVDVP